MSAVMGCNWNYAETKLQETFRVTKFIERKVNKKIKIIKKKNKLNFVVSKKKS